MATNNNASVRYLHGMDQAATRDIGVWFDQHRSSTYRNAAGESIFENGRPYYSIIETRSRMPVGPVMPLKWQAPVYAPDQYLVRSIGRVTNLPTVVGEGIPTRTTTDRFRIDYAAMLRDDMDASQVHWRLAVAEAAARDWDVPRWGQPMDRRLLAIVGPAPRSPKIAEAFIAGNPWALGQLMPSRDPQTGQMRVEEDEQLARVLQMNRDDLVTPEQAEREEEVREQKRTAKRETTHPDVVAEALAKMNELMAQNRELQMQVAQMAQGGAAPKRSHKARHPSPASV